MGYRTVVALCNDLAHDWGYDPNLGMMICNAVNSHFDVSTNQRGRFKYGHMIECVHADVETLAILHDYTGTPIAHEHHSQGQTHDQRTLRLLRTAADKLGYKVVKKPLR